jgi:zinc protease
MKRLIFSATLALVASATFAQQGRIQFEEYDLDNGLHVILHQDKSAPVVNVSIMYHVGSKNEDPKRTGFAHFFEHLLFEGTENIGRGEYMKTVQENGGVLNANTSFDRTYYFQILPSNQLELGLWLESERLLHPKIDSIGIETQRKVVKEEKKQSYDNRPYGQMYNVLFSNMYSKHPYRWMPIGTEQYIDEAKYDEFYSFFKTFYVPENAVLVIAGDFEVGNTKALIKKYFGEIKKGNNVIPRPENNEPLRSREKTTTYRDDNIQLPAIIISYPAPQIESEDAYAVNILMQILGGGQNSRLHKKLVDKDQVAVQAGASNMTLEHTGLIMVSAIANYGEEYSTVEKAIKAEVERIKKEGITQEEFQRAMNIFETSYIRSLDNTEYVAEQLATYYTYFRNTNLINTTFDKYKKITVADVNNVAKKYLDGSKSLVLRYLPNN